MQKFTLVVGVAAVALTASSAFAAPRQSRAVAGPSRPIPYSQLNAYMSASARDRANRDWWAGSAASTGSTTDTSSTSASSAAGTTNSSTTATSGSNGEVGANQAGANITYGGSPGASPSQGANVNTPASSAPAGGQLQQ